MKQIIFIFALLLLASCSSNPPSQAVDFTGTFTGYFTASDGAKGDESSVSISKADNAYTFTVRNIERNTLVGSGTCGKIQGKNELLCAFDSTTEVFTFEGPHNGIVFSGVWDYVSLSDSLNGTFRFTRQQ
jgi:hypothetical protein